MSLLEILHYPNPQLRTKAQPIKTIDDDIRRLVADMRKTMYANHGVGLAATQVGVHLQLFVMDVSEDKQEVFDVINPEIIEASGELHDAEGCLSVTGTFDKVKRFSQVVLRSMNLAGESIEIKASGLMAVCIQHEVDHLNGILFVDHLSKLKQNRIRKKFDKLTRRK